MANQITQHPFPFMGTGDVCPDRMPIYRPSLTAQPVPTSLAERNQKRLSAWQMQPKAFAAQKHREEP